jgi:DNA polymerase-3 subunit gamma/tau
VDYQALYRKYRPQRFEDVVGQSHVTSTLSREITSEQVAHAYLFTGPRGTGKTTTARIFAKALNCPDRTAEGEPCDVCDSCRSITSGSSFDVIEMDAASHNSVDDVRDLNVSVTTVASVGGGRRVFILDEAHMLSKAAANALLKTLEEPPSHVHFVLATTEPYRLLDTIRSRTQRFDFHPVSLVAIVDHLERISGMEGFTSGREGLVAIARHARGSVRDSLSLLEQVAALGDGDVDVSGVRNALGLADSEKFPRLARAIQDADAGAVLTLVQELDADGVDLRRFFAEAIGFFRGVFLAGYAGDVASIVDEPDEVVAEWKALAAEMPTATVLRAVDELGEGLVRIREGREERLMVELTLLRLVRPELGDDLGALRQRIDALERRMGKATAAQPPSVEPAPQPKPAPAPSSKPASAPRQDPEPAAPPAPSPTPAPVVEASPGEPFADPVEVDASADVDEPADTPATPLSLAAVRSAWPQVFGRLRDELGPRRTALLRESNPGAVDGDTVVLHVRMSFHLEKLRADPQVAAMVSRELGVLLGGAPKISFAPEDGAGAAPATPVVEVEEHDAADELPDKARLDEAPEQDPIALLEEAFGEGSVEELD